MCKGACKCVCASLCASLRVSLCVSLCLSESFPRLSKCKFCSSRFCLKHAQALAAILTGSHAAFFAFIAEVRFLLSRPRSYT